ncbi:MAG: sigma-54-dependent Fis family transcriptional regulator [Thiotrichales bacterium]|nr:MAG: sigma-54-dependent Fis family transcriptional regulator [Thiotrichales bacterium]
MLSIQNKRAFKSLLGRSPVMEAVIRTAQIAAATDVHILIEGETGTGKELLAQEIQSSSSRADESFIVVNCAALPGELVESLLFGHERGAFTGAHESRDGYVQKAHGGTLFLDEIGELPLPIQAKLLRFIEYGEIQRLGSGDIEVVDVRIIAATNRNLIQMVDSGEFRQDLFYRLNIVPVQLPPLRQRKRDIPELVEHFLRTAAERNRSSANRMAQDAIDLLKKYHWPGNIRELRNVCEHVSALMPGQNIKAEHLPLDLSENRARPDSSTGFELPQEGINMESLEIDLIQQALEYANGNKSEAARLLGLSRDAFLYRLKKHNL